MVYYCKKHEEFVSPSNPCTKCELEKEATVHGKDTFRSRGAKIDKMRELLKDAHHMLANLLTKKQLQTLVKGKSTLVACINIEQFLNDEHKI